MWLVFSSNNKKGKEIRTSTKTLDCSFKKALAMSIIFPKLLSSRAECFSRIFLLFFKVL